MLGLCVGCSLLAPARSIALQVDDGDAVGNLGNIAEQIASIERLPDWKVSHVDQQPSVNVAGFRGYRITVRKGWPVYDTSNAQQKAEPLVPDPAKTLIDDWEFVLVPIGANKPPVELKSQIKWQPSKCPYHTQDICLGAGRGYMWYTRGTLWHQDAVRRHFQLTGGDDPLQVLVDGLLVQDQGNMTANSVPYLIARAGDKALPYIEDAIKRADAPSQVVACLTPIHTRKSTELLLRLFHSGQQQLRHPAMYSLIHEPYRKAAKDAYFEILRERRYISRIHQACLRFGWHDALPIFREIADQPNNIQEYQQAVHARRELAGNPISKELLAAERTMRSIMRTERNAELDRQIAAARRLLIDSDDNEAANLAALMLAVYITKGGADPVQAAGSEILLARPRATTIAFLKSLAERVKAEQRPQIEKLLRMIESGVSQTEPDRLGDGTKINVSVHDSPFVEAAER
jgi:hypothetical protein